MTQNEERTYRQQHLTDWSKSQLSQEACFQSQNLSLATLGYWRLAAYFWIATARRYRDVDICEIRFAVYCDFFPENCS